jgi:hypothetical protein
MLTIPIFAISPASACLYQNNKRLKNKKYQLTNEGKKRFEENLRRDGLGSWGRTLLFRGKTQVQGFHLPPIVAAKCWGLSLQSPGASTSKVSSLLTLQRPN